MASEKQVLVSLFEHKRVLVLKDASISAAEVKAQVEKLFEDVLSGKVGEFFLQLKDDSWG